MLVNINVPDDFEMVSLDVVAMYDNISLNSVYKAVRNRWMEIAKITTIPQAFFLEMVKFCVEENNYLQFDFKYYKAKNGLAIGGCASPILADFVISDHIEAALSELSYDPWLLTKYVDDILLFGPQDEMEETLRVFNHINEQIRFTIEHKENKSITYLDMKLLRNKDGSISTDFYMKPTNKGRMLNYLSSHPQRQKINVAHNFIPRVFTLSSKEFWEKNRKMSHEILMKNGYPDSIIVPLMEKFARGRNKSPTDEEKTTSGLSEQLKKLLAQVDPNVGIGFKPKKTNRNLYPPPPPERINRTKWTKLVWYIR